jgi:hypothetical protein
MHHVLYFSSVFTTFLPQLFNFISLKILYFLNLKFNVNKQQPVTPHKASSDEPPKTSKAGRDSTHKYGRFSQEEDRKIIEV